MAQEKLKGLLAAVGARLIDNVVRIDSGPTLATLITTPVWMFSGRKKAFLGLPDAGLDDAQTRGVQNCCPHGKQKCLPEQCPLPQGFKTHPDKKTRNALQHAGFETFWNLVKR